MNLADEICNGLDEETLSAIIYDQLLSTEHKILLDARKISIGDILNGRVEDDQDIYNKLFTDWNEKLGRQVFSYGDKPEVARYAEQARLTILFENDTEKAIFEEYLKGYRAFRLEYDKRHTLIEEGEIVG